MMLGVNLAVTRALARAASSPDYERALDIMEEELAIQLAAAGGAVAKDQLDRLVKLKSMEGLQYLLGAYTDGIMSTKDIALAATAIIERELGDARGTLAESILLAAADAVAAGFENVRSEFAAALREARA